MVGISALSRKMQMETRLDLTKEINMVRQAEDIMRQKTDLRGEAATTDTVDAVHTMKKSR